MPEDLALERLRVAFLSDGARVGTCPAAEEIWAAAAGEGAPRTTRRVLDHLAWCASCCVAWRVARELRGAPAGRRSAAVGPWYRLAAGVAALALALALAFAFRPDPRIGPTLRSPTAREITSALDEGALVSRHAFKLRWRGEPAGSICRVTVADRELRPVFELGGIAGAEAAVPFAALAGQAAGALLYWQIACEPTAGEPIASSTFRARLAD